MNRSAVGLHPSDPGYDPVVDGVGRGLADLFPPIHDQPQGERGEDREPPSSVGVGEDIETASGRGRQHPGPVPRAPAHGDEL